MAYKNPIPSLDSSSRNTQRTGGLSDYVKCENVFFAFIDVLGFKQTFDEHKDVKTEFANKYSHSFKFFSYLIENTKFISKGVRETECSAGQTSDSLYFYTKRIDFLLDFIQLYSYFNLYAMSENVFFRGGIAKGNLFINTPYQFYGDSVIGAYLLESKIAKNPRIVIDESTFNSLQELNAQETEKIINFDGSRHYIMPFSNYNKEKLRSIMSSPLFEFPRIDYNKIRQNLEDNRKRYEFDDSTYAKYGYLLSELNKFENT